MFRAAIRGCRCPTARFSSRPSRRSPATPDTIRETQRLTERKIELDEGTIEMLNRRCRRLMDTLDSRPTVSITYFRPDERKDGGAYLTVTGVVRKLDPAARRIIMQDGTVIPAAEISAMEGEIFSDMDEW